MPSENPFSDLLILELASVLAGPSVGQFFAELGAIVIKIENTETRGDVTRQWKLRSEAIDNDISAYFSCANWGKKSVALNLKNPEELKHVHKLAAKADIVIASYKPGDAEKLGVDYNSLSELNPKLLYGQITGYGSQNPRTGYDAVIQAESGFMHLNGQPDSEPTKMPVALIDILAAHQLKAGLLAALYMREKNGKGQLVEVSLIQTALSSLANQGANWLVAGFNPQRNGSEHPNIVPYGTLFKTKDNQSLILAVGDDRQFRNLCIVLKVPELAENPDYKTNAGRVKNRISLTEKLRRLILEFECEPLLIALQQRNVPAGKVKDVNEALETDEAKALKFPVKNGLTGLKTVAFSFKNSLPLPELSLPPHFGQHTAEVLQVINNPINNEADLNQLFKNVMNDEKKPD